MSVDRALASNETLGLVIAVCLLLLWYRNRSFAAEIAADRDRGWPSVTRFGVGMLAIAIAWISVFDNWRELTAIPFRATRRWNYQRVQYNPPSDEVRTVTAILGAIALIFIACLVARHIGGYFLQLFIAFGAFAAWIPLFVIRSRFTLDLALGFDGDWSSPGDVAGYLAFVIVSWAFDIGLIVVTGAAVLAVVALPVTLILDVLRLRRRRVSAEAQPFFNAIGHRIAH